MFDHMKTQADQAVRELLEAARLRPGQVLVIGCSSSEIIGKRIGKASSVEAAKALHDAIWPILAARGIRLAVQCCEHLNRALVVERATAQALRLEAVNVVPTADAGGAFAMTSFQRMEDPVMVEHIRADAGLDIGGTLIGMHLKEVAVPLRLSIDRIGQANILCARTRMKYIGGPRAAYLENA